MTIEVNMGRRFGSRFACMEHLRCRHKRNWKRAGHWCDLSSSRSSADLRCGRSLGAAEHGGTTQL